MLTKAEIQRLRSLRDKSAREESGRFVVEGPKVVAELLAAKFPFVELYATPDWHGPDPGGLRRISEEEMGRISHYPTPSSILAVGAIARRALRPESLERGLTLALDGIQDPGNVGTLLRIADWYALDRVLLSPDCADLFSQKVINASMGSFARVTVHTVELPAALAGRAVPVLGCALTGESVHELPGLRDAVIVIGSEGRGLSEGVRRLTTRCLTIPRFGVAESLNAAVAAAIVCDNLRRAR